MNELIDDMARRLAAALLSAEWDRTVDPAEMEEADLSSLYIDATLDPRALARLMAQVMLAAQAEWARTASPSDVGDLGLRCQPDFFEEGLRGFTRAHGLEMGKD